MRQTRTRTARNKVVKDAYKAKIKEIKKGVGVLDSKKMQEKLSESYKLIDKAAKKNILHRNAAARKKSQIAKLVKEGKKITAKKPTSKKK